MLDILKGTFYIMSVDEPRKNYEIISKMCNLFYNRVKKMKTKNISSFNGSDVSHNT